MENLFERINISAKQTGKIAFSETAEEHILKYAKITSEEKLTDSNLLDKIRNELSDNYEIVNIAVGDLNLDDFKHDVMVLLVNYEENQKVILQILLQQKDGTYKMVKSNPFLFGFEEFPSDPNFGYVGGLNFNNIKLIVKNGFFTIERRVPDFDEKDYKKDFENEGIVFRENFLHQYFTFKYNAVHKNWFSFRYAIEHYKNFDPKPQGKVAHYSETEIEKIPIEKIKNFPGYLYYEPKLSTVYGRLTQRLEYGKPNYGETPDTDEKLNTYVLIPEIPVQVFPVGYQDPEMGDVVQKNLREIQVYSSDKKLDLKKYVDKKIILLGTLQTGRNGNIFTEVGMEINKVFD